VDREEQILALLCGKKEELRRVSFAIGELNREVPQLERLANMPEINWPDERLLEEIEVLATEISALDKERELFVARESKLFHEWNEFLDKRNEIHKFLDQGLRIVADSHAQFTGYSQDQIDAIDKLADNKVEELSQEELLVLFIGRHAKAMQKNSEWEKAGKGQRDVRDQMIFPRITRKRDLERILEFEAENTETKTA